MLTVEYQPDNVIEIMLDDEGMTILMERLASLVPGDHVHLFTPAWGGEELTEDFPRPELIPVHQVTIQMIDEAERAEIFSTREEAEDGTSDRIDAGLP